MARGSGSKRRAWWKTSSAQTRRSTTFTLEAPTPVKVNWSPWYHLNLKYFCHKGDSGGPLFRWYDTKNGRRAFILGSVSRGTGCANFNNPGIFSRVTQHLDWIRWIQWILINLQCIATHVGDLQKEDIIGILQVPIRRHPSMSKRGQGLQHEGPKAERHINKV